MEEKNLVLGRGRVLVSEVDRLTNRAFGFFEIMSVQSFSLNATVEKLPHYDYSVSERPKDGEAVIARDWTINMSVDSFNPENVGLFFGSKPENHTQAAFTDRVENLTAVLPGLELELGVTSSDFMGVRNLTDAVFTFEGAELEEDVDYTVDMLRGTVIFLAGGAVTSGGTVIATYSGEVSTVSRVIGRGDPRILTLKYESDNAHGENFVIKAPRVSISPDGAYDLISDDWSSMSFTAEVLKVRGREMLYRDNRPLTLAQLGG